MNLNCKDCSAPLEDCRCTEITIDPNQDRERIIQSIEARITTEYKKHHRSLPNDWARIAAGKIFSTHFMMVLIAFVMVSCNSQKDPCVHLHERNYTDEWFYKGNERFQVYKTRFGKRFIYEMNQDSTAFKRKFIKI
jgi:hypothetical protein